MAQSTLRRLKPTVRFYETINAQSAMDLFARLHQEGGHTIVLVSHAPEAAYYARRVVHLKDGRVQP